MSTTPILVGVLVAAVLLAALVIPQERRSVSTRRRRRHGRHTAAPAPRHLHHPWRHHELDGAIATMEQRGWEQAHSMSRLD